MHGDWITATATIIAAIIGIVGGYLLALYQRDRRVVRFLLSDTEDLASTLREHGAVEIKFASYSISELILSTITIRNAGNRTVKDLAFAVKIPGEHQFAKLDCSSKNSALIEQMNISPSSFPNIVDPTFKVALPFFNAGETFRLTALYNGKPADCEITCRLEDAIVEVLTSAEYSRQTSRRNVWKTIATGIFGFLTAVVSALISYYFKH